MSVKFVKSFFLYIQIFANNKTRRKEPRRTFFFLFKRRVGFGFMHMLNLFDQKFSENISIANISKFSKN